MGLVIYFLYARRNAVQHSGAR
ncbi:protein of unknown function (plasmid) [Cupriavidus taiwanensis]|uniref:Uncharacterized protein n=1 Tax=Cupriavidus taiwanensis TaxID=164546 RepID=A0A375IJ91_9BURK|nr:hypothetical protein CBM2617_U10113 [Cupriavidus taiwanensis]SPA53890.1 hypothetical protein CBM2629_U30020 [Cupriavidus taiwanensis]SPK74804.1 protein of unknown function [Cupriavidus taiwanensis]